MTCYSPTTRATCGYFVVQIKQRKIAVEDIVVLRKEIDSLEPAIAQIRKEERYEKEVQRVSPCSNLNLLF
jgi:hypothetical protein